LPRNVRAEHASSVRLPPGFRDRLDPALAEFWVGVNWMLFLRSGHWKKSLVRSGKNYGISLLKVCIIIKNWYLEKNCIASLYYHFLVKTFAKALKFCIEFWNPWYTKWFHWIDFDVMLFSDRLLNNKCNVWISFWLYKYWSL